MEGKKRVFLVFKEVEVDAPDKTIDGKFNKNWKRGDIVGVVIASSHKEAAEKMGGVLTRRTDEHAMYFGETEVSIPVDPTDPTNFTNFNLVKGEGFVKLENGLRASIYGGQDRVRFNIVEIALIL